MKNKDYLLLDMLSLVYEDMDIDAIEERFVNLVAEIFSFDRVGLFFVKHRNGMLQGKLCKGFEPGTISSIEIPVTDDYLFTKPLITGFPIWGKDHAHDPFTKKIGLDNFAIIPIASKKRISCWQIKNCETKDCPAYGNKLLRCWLMPGTKCSDGTERTIAEKAEMCEVCPVFASQNTNTVEGILLIDNSESRQQIDEKTVTLLSVVAHAVGVAINNSKTYSNVLRDSIHDELTGLHNRRYFNERLLDEIDRAQRYGSNISLLLCDIDHFKNINDTYGHPTGDQVLIWLGKTFRDKLRNTDIIARYGGEEFAIILLNAEEKETFQIAEELRSTIADAAIPGHDNIRISISIGISILGKDSGNFNGMINNADKALYHAKSQGRNKVCML